MKDLRSPKSEISKSNALRVSLLRAPSSLLLALSALLFALSFFMGFPFPACSLHAPCASAWAQQPKKIPRIGYLATRSRPSGSEEAFVQGLRSLGYIEGQTILMQWRCAGENFDPFPDLARELAHLKADAIDTSGGTPP